MSFGSGFGSGGGFGSTNNNSGSGFGGFGGFGSGNTSNTNTGGGFSFGSNNNNQPASSGALFGAANNTSSGGFGSSGGEFNWHCPSPSTAFRTNSQSPMAGIEMKIGRGSRNPVLARHNGCTEKTTPKTSQSAQPSTSSSPNVRHGSSQSAGLDTDIDQSLTEMDIVGFGSTPSTGFGAKPGGFGATNTSTSGGSLFGSNTATAPAGGTGFGGGFGNNASTTSAFGSTNTTGGLFGQNKPAATGFGSSATGTGGLFGSGGTTTSTPAFGAGAATAMGNQPTSNNGTAGTPFTAYTEKDNAANQNAHYQTITFQQPYQAFSLEELRFQDYQQGRRYGNANGQAGAFGTSTGFGGFGSSNNSTTTPAFGANNTSTGGGMFGSGNTNTTTGFGSTPNNTSTGFGSNTGNSGLFGAKPATGGLFGSTPASQPASGGMFGSAGSTGSTGFGNTGSAFGGAAANTSSPFGANNQTQNKPAFGGFGSAGTGSAFGGSTGGFGQQSNTSTGSNLFGGANNNAGNTASPFGAANNNTAQNTSSPFGGFGQNNQAQPQQNQTSGLFGSGFGANNNNQQQNKPLFGGASTGTTGSLFGSNTQQQNQPATGGLFGGANNNQQQNQGGLFGAKPAGTTGGLFGSGSTQNTNTGSNLFGGLGQNQNNTQNQAGGMFGGANNQQQQQQNKPLFGASTGSTGGMFGGSTFGQNNNNNTSGALGGSLFGGNAQQNQPQQSTLGGSLFGNSTAQQSTNQAPSLTASLKDNPYGHDNLFASLTSPSASVGPLATPLSSSQKNKKSAILPQHRINPAASSRLITPQKRMGGLGFSTYGTPGTALASGSPGLGNSMVGGGSFSKSLAKSFSTSTLRSPINTEDSILSPGAFNPAKRPSYANTGSMKKLNINRSLNVRPSLFGDEPTASPASQKKRVSFDASTTLSNGHIDSTNGALVPAERESATPSAEEQGFLRSSKNGETPKNVFTNGDKPEVEQAKGNEVVLAQENGSSPSSSRGTAAASGRRSRSRVSGDYWAEPPVEQLKKMSKQELKSVANFRVGRIGVGEIQFEKPVDLTGVDLDRMFSTIISIKPRNVTVYPVKGNTPPVGKGLNVQSLITLENSWPRASKEGTETERHAHYLQRLKEVEDTEFVDWDSKKGVWRFRVFHYTTYGLDYDEDEDVPMDQTPALPSPTPMARNSPLPPLSSLSRLSGVDNTTLISPAESSPDDTFEFKRGKVSTRSVPGSFDTNAPYYEDDHMVDGQDDTITSTHSFLDERSVGPYEEGSDMDAASYRSGSDSEPEQNMVGSFPVPDRTTEPTPTKNSVFDATGMPKSILKQSQPFRNSLGTPARQRFDFEGDWAAQLQRTISPKKQDRQALRDNQSNVLKKFDEKDEATPKANKTTGPSQSITNHIDLMSSLFGASTARKTGSIGPGQKRSGLEWPYQKTPKTGDDLGEMDERDHAFHDSFKPSWTPDGGFTYAVPGSAPRMRGNFFNNVGRSLVGQRRDVRFAKFATPDDIWSTTMAMQALPNNTKIIAGEECTPPRAMTLEMEFKQLAQLVDTSTSAGKYEQQVWKLASILFDNIYTFEKEVPPKVKAPDFRAHEEQIRAEMLSDFWQSIVLPEAQRQARLAKSPEEKAIAYLSANCVSEACHVLIEGRNFRLATLISQIGGPASTRAAMDAQIDQWRAQGVWSEFAVPIRALYTLMAGECAVIEAADGPQTDQAEAVRISQELGLDWRQAFGLRLWYRREMGTTESSVFDTVKDFQDELTKGDEAVRPVPWFVREGVDMGWDDPKPQEREDLLWGLLKLYKAHSSKTPSSVTGIFSPENATGNPLNARLSWQLLTLLRAKNILPREVANPSWKHSGPGDEVFSMIEVTELSDHLNTTFALPLLNEEHWTHAAWLLIHLTDDTVRAEALKSLLSFHASRITGAGISTTTDPTKMIDRRGPIPGSINEPSERYVSVFTFLTEDLKIPAPWIYEALAQHARAVLNDHYLEVRYLLLANLLVTAHNVLISTVAPAAVIANTADELDALRDLLGKFVAHPMHPSIPSQDWKRGGLVYEDYLQLLQQSNAAASAASTGPVAVAFLERERAKTVPRLASSLASLAPDLGSKELIERAALKEIAGRLLKSFGGPGSVAGAKGKGASASLQAQLKELRGMGVTEEVGLRVGRAEGLGYYRAVVGGVRV
ncbi:nuclear protein 96-domain-containing protein [Phyllosticta capitalensis]